MTDNATLDRPAKNASMREPHDSDGHSITRETSSQALTHQSADDANVTADEHSSAHENNDSIIADHHHSAVTGESTRNRLLNSPLQLSERQEMIRIVSNRLFVALISLLSVTIVGSYLTWVGHEISAGATNWMVLLCGAFGGFISLQRRLKTLAQDDLLLLARSWVYVLLAPMVGAILALLLYFLFISGLLQGDLFPNFDTSRALTESGGIAPVLPEDSSSKSGLSVLFQVQGVAYKDYAKLVFWCFVAGYSESFVTNIISNFESTADNTASNQ